MNVYFSCGCVAREDIPGTVRCEVHGGFVISNASIVPKAKVRNDENGMYCYANLLRVMQVEKEVDLIVIGHNASIFFRYSIMDSTGIRETECMYLDHIYKSGVPAVILVEPSEMPVLLYQMHLRESAVSMVRTTFDGVTRFAMFINVEAKRGITLQQMLMRVADPKRVLVTGMPMQTARQAYADAYIIHVTEHAHEFRS